MTNTPPTQIGSYRILGLLGQNRWHESYLASHLTSDHKVVIKLFTLTGLNSDLRGRFAWQLATLQKLDPDHPHLIEIEYVGSYDNRPYLVLDYVPGGDLAELIHSQVLLQQMPISEVWYILKGLAEALDHIHEQGVVHGQVEPENILFDEEGEPRLSHVQLLSLPSRSVFASPEQRAGHLLNHQADVYSLAAVAYVMLTNTPPAATNPKPITELRPDLPPTFDALFQQGLAQRAEERFYSAGAFVEQFEEALSLSSRLQQWGSEVLPAGSRWFQNPTVQNFLFGFLFTFSVGLIIFFVFFFDSFKERRPQVLVPTARPTATKEYRKTEIAQTTPTPTRFYTNPDTGQSVTPYPTEVPFPSSTPTPTPTFIPTPPLTNLPNLGATFLLPTGQSVSMVYVHGGPFFMGSLENPDEQPVRTIFLDDYWIDQHEVTNAEFALFVADQSYITTGEKLGSGNTYLPDEQRWWYINGVDWQHPFGPDSSIVGLEQHPVVLVSWKDAQAYCSWRGGSLPTEAQWEKAARGTEQFIYPWGNTFNSNGANYCDKNCPFEWQDTLVDDGYTFTAPVGSYSPAGDSPYGVQDMAGNVWEWTFTNHIVHPTAQENLPKVIRGGSWNDHSSYLRTANRGWLAYDKFFLDVGFRCVLPANYPPTPTPSPSPSP